VALDRALRRILAQGTDRGWVRHRQVHYLLLVREVAGEMRVMTLGRALSWQAEPAGPASPVPPVDPSLVPRIRRPAGYYGR